MKTSTFASAAALLSSSYAATVTFETTPCLDPSYPREQFDIELNPSGPVPKDLQTVCGLRILSASSGVDINTIQCQAFKDIAGNQPGSAVFTFAEPALIATNPVQELSILCTYPTPNTGKFRRQDNGTVSASSGAAVSATVLSTATLPVGSPSSAVRSTVTSTQVVTASSGMPSPSGNLTMPSTTLRPSASQTSEPPKETPGAANSVSVGMGVVVAAIAAMLV